MNDHPQGHAGEMPEEPVLGDPAPVPEGLWARLVDTAVNAPADPDAAALVPEIPPPDEEDAYLDVQAADVDADTGGDDPLQSIFPDDTVHHHPLQDDTEHTGLHNDFD